MIVKYSISFAITFVISIINYILDRVLFYLTEFIYSKLRYEKNRTFTYFYLSQSLKLTVLTFINSAITPLLVNIVNGKFYTNKGIFYLLKEILMQDLFVIFLSNSLVTPFTYILPPYHYFLVIRRKYLLRHKDNLPSDLTQKQVNE